MVSYFPIVTGSLTVLGNISVSGSITTSGSITISGSITSASFATSASNATNAISASYANNLTVAGTLTAQTLVVQTITSSVDFVTGSTRFGSILANTHVFSGSVTMNPNGLFVSSSGVVGVNTTSPLYALDVTGFNATGSLRVKNTGTHAQFTVDGTTGLFFRDGTNAAWKSWLIATSYNDGSEISFIPSTNTSGAPTWDTTAMVIQGNGRVGIGTTTPNATLTSKGSYTIGTSIPTTGMAGLFSGRLMVCNNNKAIYFDVGSTDTEISTYNFDSGGGNVLKLQGNGGLIVKGTDNTTTGQFQIGGQTGSPPNAILVAAADQNGPYPIGVKALSNPSSQGLVGFFDYTNNSQGNISISSTTISYNSFMGSHWSQFQDNSKPKILKGTILEAIDELCEWEGETNDRLAKIKISNTVESKNVYGVFFDWDNMDNLNDMYVAALGAGYVRVNGSQTIQMGDLLQSNGDGTAKIQSDDIMRSSTIAKVVSTNKIETYEDGSYLIAATLHCG